MATWPTTLPAITFPVGYAKRETRIRTQMEAGPDKVRTRFSNETIDVATPDMVLTKAQVDTLETFFVTTLNGGVDTFTWDDPMTGLSTDNFRFVERPRYRALRSATAAADRLWAVSFGLEILP